MDPWFDVLKKDVIEILEKTKDVFPWGEHPDEKYQCLLFWDEEKIWMTVDEFFELDDDTYECCRFYTTILADTIEEYRSMPEEEMVSKAYSAWCSGAR